MRLAYPQPANEADFEILCLHLLQRHWDLPSLERYARRGEGQDGVDIIDVGGRTPIWAAQCKLHEPGKSLPPREIRAEVSKAKLFQPALGRYAILTTGKVSGHAQKAVREINASHRSKGLFEVEVITWDRIQELLARYPEVARANYQTATNDDVVKIDEKLGGLQRDMATGRDLAAVKVAMESIGTSLKTGRIETIIRDASGHLERRDFQVARALLNSIRERDWDDLSDAQKYKILTNLANVSLAEGKATEAGRRLLEATSYGTGEEKHLANEALARELLGDTAGALKLVDAALDRFPHSPRLVAIRLRNAAPDRSLDELESDVPAYLARDPDVATALAFRATQAGDDGRAEAWARRAIAGGQEHPGAFVLLAQAMLNLQLRGLAQIYGDRPRVGDRAATVEAKRAYDQAVERAAAWRSTDLRAEALLGRATAEHALHEDESADADFTAAVALMPDHAVIRRRYASYLHAAGDHSRAIVQFRRAISLGDGGVSGFFLALALLARDDPGDGLEASRLLSGAVADAGSLRRADALRVLVDRLIDGGGWEEAGRLLDDELKRGGIGAVTMAVLRAKVCLAAGRTQEAGRLADEAMAGLGPEDDTVDHRALARVLDRIGRFGDALPIWMGVVAPADGDPDTAFLVHCAARTGHHDLLLEAARAARLAGLNDDLVRRQELAILELYDPEEAIRLQSERLVADPDDREARLHLAHLRFITGRPDPGAGAWPLPPVGSVSAHDGFLVASILRRCGRHDEARRYAYELLRRLPAEPDAHRALHVATLGMVGPGPEVEPPQVVAPGTAVKYVEGRDGSEGWLIIEDAPEPNPLLHEYAPDHPVSVRALGRTVGDEFILAHGRMQARPARVAEIRDKFLHRAWESVMQWQVRFPDEPGFELVRLPSVPSDGGEEQLDFDVLFRGLDRRFEVVKRVESAYRSSSMTVHQLSCLLGRSTLAAVEHLAHTPGLAIRCCPGTPQDWKCALDGLESGEIPVVDSTALKTLMMLGLEDALRDLPCRVVVPQAVIREITAQIEVDRMGERDHYVMNKAEVGYTHAQVGAEVRRTRRVHHERLLELIRDACEVRDGRPLAAVAPGPRGRLIDILGRDGAEAILLAARPGHILWTDDHIAASLAAQEFRARRVWTQAVLQRWQATGVIDVTTYGDTCARLLGWGYTATRFDAATIARAGCLADWDVDGWPLGPCLDLFANDAINLRELLPIAASLLVQAHRHVASPVVRDIVTIRVAERLAARSIGALATRMLADLIPAHFGLNVVRQIEASRVIAAWLSSRAVPLLGA